MKPYFLIVFYLTVTLLTAQDTSSVDAIIQKINLLENEKDPKCYATANRLEDFMYGTPLNEGARNLKIEIQKALITHLRVKGSENANKRNASVIENVDLKRVIAALSSYKQDAKGDFFYKYRNGYIPIKKKDFIQYSSVSYGYRSLLSVEQDLLFSSIPNLKPFASDLIDPITNYINLTTLVALKIADNEARKTNTKSIDRVLMRKSWVAIFQQSKNNIDFSNPNATRKASPKTSKQNDDLVIKKIIKQKLASYENYNHISEPVFLRNIQVYFARQKWPTDSLTSNALKNYYIASLTEFSNSLLKASHKIASEKKHTHIRLNDVQVAAKWFLPVSVNAFEDVTFFPNNVNEKITVESYDLDAFRDGGIHWSILDYSLRDTEKMNFKSLDPNAAELVVENIAQLGVLVLRIAGEHSHANNQSTMQQEDIEAGFKKIQVLINDYDSNSKEIITSTISSSDNLTQTAGSFVLVNDKVGVNFEHKSADWLNRLIRSYAVSNDNNVKTVTLSIPPAFSGSGVACEDLNNDGFPDLLLLGGFGNTLYLNNKNGTFKDITAQSGINFWDDHKKSFGEPRQPIIADFDNDGYQDIFISYVNDAHQVFKNIEGKRLENLSHIANLGGKNAVAGPATAFDYNNDGLLDIFIGYFGDYIHGVLPTISRDNQNGVPNRLFKNLGNFVFEEVVFTEDHSSNTGWTQVVGHSDLNQDGYQDIIVGNDFGKNKYYFGSPKGKFKEVSNALGTDKPSYSMNIGITDLNRDLYPDLYISNIVVMQKDEKYVSPNENTTMKFDPKKMANIRTIEANDLFLSSFSNHTLNYSLSTAVGSGYSATGWSWDADFFDYDNDGDDDLYCLNGMNDFSVYASENPFYFERTAQASTITYAPSDREKNVFFVNENGTLTNKAESLGVAINSNARSASYFDFDQDGDLDIIVNNYHDAANFLQNHTSLNNNWVKIKLIGDPSKHINRDAIGSSFVINSLNNKNIWKEIHSTTGYLSVHPKEQHIGLGKDNMFDLTIQWSNGEVYILKDLQGNKKYTITYPNNITE